jgi:hypothetical protein
VLRRLEAGYSAPAVPADTLVVDMWGSTADQYRDALAVLRGREAVGKAVFKPK